MNDFFKKIKKFESNSYINERLDNLIIVAIYKLKKAEMECSFENVVVTVHKLFPEKFSLTNFPEFPDTIRVDNTLRLDAKKHSGFLDGNRVNGYVLTGLGEVAANDTLEKLESGKNLGKKRTDVNRNKYIKLVNNVRSSSAFKKFSDDKKDKINKFDLCEVLHCTIDSDQKQLENNLKTLKIYSEKIQNNKNYGDISKKVLMFLNFVEKKLELS